MVTTALPKFVVPSCISIFCIKRICLHKVLCSAWVKYITLQKRTEEFVNAFSKLERFLARTCEFVSQSPHVVQTDWWDQSHCLAHDDISWHSGVIHFPCWFSLKLPTGGGCCLHSFKYCGRHGYHLRINCLWHTQIKWIGLDRFWVLNWF